MNTSKCIGLVFRMSHRKWREVKQEPNRSKQSCLVSFHLLFKILNTSLVLVSKSPKSAGDSRWYCIPMRQSQHDGCEHLHTDAGNLRYAIQAKSANGQLLVGRGKLYNGHDAKHDSKVRFLWTLKPIWHWQFRIICMCNIKSIITKALS